MFVVLLSHWTPILKAKYLALVQTLPLSGKTWEGVSRCSSAEGRYCRHKTLLHPQMGKMKPEVIVEVLRNKHQSDKGPGVHYNVVLIYFKKPQTTGDTTMQYTTKPKPIRWQLCADLCTAEQGILYIETNSRLLHNVVLNINTWKHRLTHCLFPFGPTSAL